MPTNGAEPESPGLPPRRRIARVGAPAERVASVPDSGPYKGSWLPPTQPRLRIFIVDSGWNSAAREVLHDNFHLLRELQRETPIYLLGRDRSIELLRRYPLLVGRDPIIRVHCEVLRHHRPPGFHGFRLHLGLLKEHDQALTALQKFIRFIGMHRDSQDMEMDMRKKLRMEGLKGAFEVIAHGDLHSVI